MANELKQELDELFESFRRDRMDFVERIRSRRADLMQLWTKAIESCEGDEISNLQMLKQTMGQIVLLIHQLAEAEAAITHLTFSQADAKSR